MEICIQVVVFQRECTLITYVYKTPFRTEYIRLQHIVIAMMEGSRCAFKVDEEERLDLYSDCSVDLTTKNQKRQVSSIGDSRELLELERIRRLLPDPELQAQKPSAVKKARREEAFDKEREKNRRRLQMNLPFCQSLSETLSKELREKLQGIVDTALQSAIEAHYCPSGYQTTKALVLEKKREVVYIGLGFRFVLTVLNYRCSKCPLSADRITVHPYQVGCVPTSPTVNCETWISLDYCKLFGNLQATSKVSANGKNFCCCYLAFLLFTVEPATKK